MIRDGEVLSAAEEERFRRIKHWAGFPEKSIWWCLAANGIQLSDIDVIAVNQDPGANRLRKFLYTLVHRPQINLLIDKLKIKKARSSLRDNLEVAFPDQRFTGKIQSVEHHYAHLASAFYPSEFDEAWAVSVDGFGDFASCAWGIGSGSEIDVHERVLFPDSLGVFYQAMTQFLGFPAYGDEHKVMGMAPYGKPAFLTQMREILLEQSSGRYALNLEYFRHHRESVLFEWKSGPPVVGTLYSPALTEMLGESRSPDTELSQRHFDIAHSVQAMYEIAFFRLLETLYRQRPLPNLALAGGCAMNSVANGKICRKTPFKKVYIQPAAGDAGGAVGSAFTAWFNHSPYGVRKPMTHAYLGPEESENEIGQLLDNQKDELDAAGCVVRRFDDFLELCSITAGSIAEGKVIGWFQGRMEWGPRALGNRSILCDPRRQDMKDILNSKIKRRESFRPFAPSILREQVSEWFEEEDEVPFMMKVFQVRENKRALIPAVTHVDGSGRLQTVTSESNERYYKLITAFYRLSDIPILLNTSFNENEPIVCRSAEALDCFFRTRMDMLVLGNWVISRVSD